MMKWHFVSLFMGLSMLCLGQKTDYRAFDVRLRGYLFTTQYGVFFQPLEFNRTYDFLSSLNKTSFQINENNLTPYYLLLKGVGNSIIVKKFFEDSNQNNHTSLRYDTIYYFNATIDITMNFFEKDYMQINDLGYAFIMNDSLIYYGNLTLRNQLHTITPAAIKHLKELYNSYKKNHMSIPRWLSLQLFKKK